MKLRLINTQLIAAILIFLAACGSDNELKIKNEVMFDGEQFTVTTASIAGVAIDNEGHAGINLIRTNGIKTETLTIDVDYFGNSPVVGTYSYPQGANDLFLNDFLTNYVVFDNQTMTSVSLSEGSVTVESNGGNNHTVVMDLTMEDGSVFRGTYRGEFVVGFNNQ